MVLWVFPFCFLIGALVPYGCGLSYYFMEPWLDKRSGRPRKTWVELLVLEALVGKTL